MTRSPLIISLYGKQIGRLVSHGPEVWTATPFPNATLAPEDCWSLGMLTSTQAEHANVRGWFRALLPDLATCHRLALQRGLTPGNDFALLAALGGDCQGALSLEAPTPAVPVSGGVEDPGILTEALASGTVATAPVSLLRGLWPGDGGLLPVRHSSAGPRLPGTGEPSNALLRIGRLGLADVVRNEAFCMQLAASLEVPVVRTELANREGGWLVSERPDANSTSPSGRWHMESFGQLLGLPAEQGFEREGGLALVDCCRLIRRYSAVPALDLRSLLRWLVFCHLIGNGLACGRDLKLLFTPKGPRLAPFVGILSTHVYPEMSDRLGFQVGREDRPDWLLPARWREQAEELGIGQRYLLGQLRQLVQALPPAVASMAERWRGQQCWSPVLEQVVALAERRARQLWVALEAERG